MASMRDIKRRKESVQSTQQITKAMKLVATVKLQKSRQKAESNKPYFNMLYDTICSILAKTQNVDHRFIRESESKKKAVICITSNRGLAGGYNSNVVKTVIASGLPKEDTFVYAIGKKGIEGLRRKGFNIYQDDSEVINAPLFADATELTKQLLTRFEKGEIGEIYIADTILKNTVVHVPRLQKLLPLGKGSTPTESVSGKEGEDTILPDAEEESAKRALMTYEPDEDEALSAIIPKYVTSLIYGALIEAVASENGARMQAMDSATDNAEKMISNLELQYNRARQGAITQELTEIIGGAEALG